MTLSLAGQSLVLGEIGGCETRQGVSDLSSLYIGQRLSTPPSDINSGYAASTSSVLTQPAIPARIDLPKHEPQSRQRLYWNSLILMIVALFLGILFAIGHHFYYGFLNGQAVGNSTRQQWALQLGSAFAYLTKVCLCASAEIACIQWLWRSLRRKYVTVKGIDAAFSVSASLASFASWDMISSLKVVSLFALITWCIPLIALVTPATLSVEVKQATTHVFAEVPTLNIPQNLNWTADQNSTERQLAPWTSLTIFEGKYGSINGPAERLKTVMTALSSTGQVAHVAQPFLGGDYSYRVELIAPSLRCEPSSPEVARNTTIFAVLSDQAGSLPDVDRYHELNGSSSGLYQSDEIDFNNLTFYPQNGPAMDLSVNFTIGYYATLPWGEWYRHDEEEREHVLEYGYEYGTRNEIHIVVADHDPETNATIPRHITCTLWNTSIEVNITAVNGTQTINPIKLTHLNEVGESQLELGARKDPELANTALYTGYFRGLAKPITGYFAMQELDSGDGQNPRLPQVNMPGTIFTGSNEFIRMSNNEALFDRAFMFDPRNQSLSDTIEEYAVNVSLSLMANDHFNSKTIANVARTDNVNVYTYEPRNLLIAYGIAILASSIVVVVGLFAYWSNGVSYSSHISTIIRTMQNPELRALVSPHSLGQEPLPVAIANTKLKFGILTEAGKPTTPDSTGDLAPALQYGFGTEGTTITLGEKSQIRD